MDAHYLRFFQNIQEAIPYPQIIVVTLGVLACLLLASFEVMEEVLHL